jgi:hypothetical protein
MPRFTSFLVWFVALELLWVVLVGTTQSTELLAGLAAAAIGAAFVEVLRSLNLFEYRVEFGLLLKAWKLPWLVLFDFGVATRTLVRSLARGGRVRGRWVRVPFPTEPGPTGRWQRAFSVATSNGAANAIVVDLAGDEALLHALEPDLFTARTVL